MSVMKRIVVIGLAAFLFILSGCTRKNKETAAIESNTVVEVQLLETQMVETLSSEIETIPQTLESLTIEETESISETVPPAFAEEDLVIANDSSMYTYENMVNDIKVMSEIYGNYLYYDVLGETADGRVLFDIVIGNPNAEKQIFINAGTHAREFLTCQLVMKQLYTYIQHIKAQDFYGEISYLQMWDECMVHLVPMVNPDGVTISQIGLEGIRNENLRQTILTIAQNDGKSPSTDYFDHWKANAEGVDINRNFDAYWEKYNDHLGRPSSDHYKGEYPGSSVEAKALIDLTEENAFLYTISYHTQGEIIYWRFENIDQIYDRAHQWVEKLSKSTGYRLYDNYEVVDPAGYSDWGIYRCFIPSITLEVAKGESPYLASQFNKVFEENKEVWEITILEALAAQTK